MVKLFWATCYTSNSIIPSCFLSSTSSPQLLSRLCSDLAHENQQHPSFPMMPTFTTSPVSFQTLCHCSPLSDSIHSAALFPHLLDSRTLRLSSGDMSQVLYYSRTPHCALPHFLKHSVWDSMSTTHSLPTCLPAPQWSLLRILQSDLELLPPRSSPLSSPYSAPPPQASVTSVC